MYVHDLNECLMTFSKKGINNKTEKKRFNELWCNHIIAKRIMRNLQLCVKIF